MNTDRLPTEESEAASIIRRMSELGYHPDPGRETARVCFYKDFSDEEGRRARVTVYFDKPIMGVDVLRFSSIVISTQVVMPATIEAINREAPGPLRDDLTAVLQRFPEYLIGVPEQSVVVRTCIKCKQAKSKFYVISSDAVCFDCVEARKSGA